MNYFGFALRKLIFLSSLRDIWNLFIHDSVRNRIKSWKRTESVHLSRFGDLSNLFIIKTFTYTGGTFCEIVGSFFQFNAQMGKREELPLTM